MNKHQLLQRYYGYSSFRSGQAQIIDHIMHQEDVLAIMPTGAGKSICFQIPAMLLPGITVVISPLISLMNDQVMTLTQQGIPAACIHGLLSPGEYYDVLRMVRMNAIKILYIAPERLLTSSFMDTLGHIEVSMIAVDEAHCVSQWGHDFRPSYLDIPTLVESLPIRPIVSAFTATATPSVKRDIETLLKLKKPFILRNGFDRKNLFFEVQQPSDKDQTLKQCLLRFRGRSGIIYCSTRKAVDQVYASLLAQRYEVARYHAGLPDEDRMRYQEDFLYDRKTIMVATNAFGMGIDKSNVNFVIHYNMPKNMESYYQEAGRAGRDGEDATCIMLFHARDVIINKYLIENSKKDVDPQYLKHEMAKLNAMTSYAQGTSCLRASILSYFGETPSEFCGKCSVCDSRSRTIDITITSQKILSCVFRMHKAMAHGNDIIDQDILLIVLRGMPHVRVSTHQFDSLSTYGILKDQSLDQISAIIAFLLQENYLAQADDTSIILGSKASLILVDKQPLSMKIAKQASATWLNEAEEHLFMELLELRKLLAQQQRVAPTMIFTDVSLRALAKYLPRNLTQLSKIPGIGFVKVNRYGKQILQIIEKHSEVVE